MIRYIALLAAVVFLATACKRTDPPEPVNNLVGRWATAVDGVDFHSFTFTEKMEYSYTGYNIGESGIYSTDKADLRLIPAISGAGERILSFEIAAGKLTLHGRITNSSTTSQTIVLQKL